MYDKRYMTYVYMNEDIAILGYFKKNTLTFKYTYF